MAEFDSVTVSAEPHQFRTRNDANRTQRTRSKQIENSAKSTDPIDLLPLITVWLQVRTKRARECATRQRRLHLFALQISRIPYGLVRALFTFILVCSHLPSTLVKGGKRDAALRSYAFAPAE
jgi:hypothetical protein